MSFYLLYNGGLLSDHFISGTSQNKGNILNSRNMKTLSPPIESFHNAYPRIWSTLLG